MDDLPRLLADFSPVPGVIKTTFEDFVVEEIPLYPADGTGAHTYFLVEKAGLTTHQAVHSVAQSLGVRRMDIGVAGLKDAHAITRQWMSIEHVPPERVAALDIPRVRILDTTRHRNKLRMGHLQGNHFAIKVRQTEPHRLADLQNALAELRARGVPNYFGPQRFGYRGDTWAVGQAILRNDSDEALALIVGRPADTDHGPVRRARKLFEMGNFPAAARAWPYGFHTERRLLKALVRVRGNPRRALATLDRTARNFFVSAYQSYLFNRIVAARLPRGLHTLLAGDLAFLHASGAVFRVTDPAAEQSRAAAFEISPTGPLFGYRMTAPDGEPGVLEQQLLDSEQLTPEAFRAGPLRAKGGRRPLRFSPGPANIQLGADEYGEYLALEFALPSGCYATALLRELFQLSEPRSDEPAGEETEAEGA